jgi:cytochrome c556
MKTARTFTVGAVCALVAATTAFAGPHDAAIKARQSLMTLYAFNIGPLGAMAKGEMEYNADVAAKAAADLAALTRTGSAAMWPQGSDSDAHEGTRALAAIWQNFPDVGAKAADLRAAADALAEAAGTGLDGLRAAIGPVGAACGA